ncbi:MAG: translation initiation factor IF-2 [Candidatus Moranbacteria bacterium]|nr:translation initiation factor IF-2 [Candidatus Moranbacteria bacterium]
MTEQKIVEIPFRITVKELSAKMNLEVGEVLKKLMDNGIITGLNEYIDYETAFIIAEELGFEPKLVESVSEKKEMTFEKLQEILSSELQNDRDLSSRPPIVTILGHVDHGKTTLLDTLKKTHIADKEAGGITQHISAYQVEKNKRLITFIDTPGHEAFQAMRQRGANIADIAILVVAADDGVKPQTKEVIEFILKNKIPVIVAINKIDKPEANVNRVKQKLAENGLLVEGYGGEILVSEISAKNNIGLDKLLENILLLEEIYNFRANPKRNAMGVVLEAHKDSRKGPLATVLIKTGFLKTGQDILVGKISGKIRRLENYAGKNIPFAGPSMPVVVAGLEDIPQTHDILQVIDQVTAKKKRLIKKIGTSNLIGSGPIDSQQFMKNIDENKKTRFCIILKADVQGTLEAIAQIIENIPSDEIRTEIIVKGVGKITETDVKNAQAASNCLVYGFSVDIDPSAKSLARNLGIDIKKFDIIYELIKDIKAEMSKLLSPEIEKIELGKLKILAVFRTAKNSIIAGGKVVSGKIVKGENLEITRNKESIGIGKLVQLQHNKEDVAEVKEGLECGITFEGRDKIEVGDTLLCFKEEKKERKI